MRGKFLASDDVMVCKGEGMNPGTICDRFGMERESKGQRMWRVKPIYLSGVDFGELPAVGVEPTLPCGNKILSLARLPISPRRQHFLFILCQ